jgi:hypothetical protein
MGMYADVRGVEIKYSGLIAKAIRCVKGPEAADNGFVTVTKSEVRQVLLELDSAIKAAGIVDGSGQISRSSCFVVANAAKFAGLLSDWWLSDNSEDRITFG